MLYSQNREAGLAPKKYTRHIPQAPERILDAPELLDDYYLNLLDWSPNNVLGVALGDATRERVFGLHGRLNVAGGALSISDGR